MLAPVYVHADDAAIPDVPTGRGLLHLQPVAVLEYPWSIVFLPDGDMLVSEKHPGRLRRVSPEGKVSEPITGLPPIHPEGNGGLLGLALDPKFKDNHYVYFAFAEAGEEGPGVAEAKRTFEDHPEKGAVPTALAVGRGKLEGGALKDVEIIFRQAPKVNEVRNFGGRLLFGPDGKLYIFTADRFFHEKLQTLTTTLGVVARINPDGSIPKDNPFVGKKGADPSIWAYGFRNIEGAAFDPKTGELWISDIGPKGGDELDLVKRGKNYGWPAVSWGRHYTDKPIPFPTTRPDLEDAVFFWTPVITPSGMVWYQGDKIPSWKGNLILGGLSSTGMTRLTIKDDHVIANEWINLGLRIREVAQGPDGSLYVTTDEKEGKILKVTVTPPPVQLPPEEETGAPVQSGTPAAPGQPATPAASKKPVKSGAL